MGGAFEQRLRHACEILTQALLRFLTPERVRIYPVITLVVLACIAAYDRLTGAGLINGLDGTVGGDFMSFYTGGQFARHGLLDRLTDADAQALFQRQVLGKTVSGVSVWVSPPYFAWAFLPFAYLPYVWAYLAVVGVSIGIVMLALSRLRVALPSSSSSSSGRMLWLCLQYCPTVEWLLNGQMTGLWLAVFAGVFILLRRGRDLSAGLLLGSLACKPQLALGVAVVFVASRRWRAIFGAALSALALVAAGFALAPGAMQSYLRHGSALVALVRDAGYHRAGLHGSFEFATLLLDGVSPKLAVIVGSTITLGLLAAIAAVWSRAPWDRGTREWDLRMAATFAIAVIASPHLYNYDLGLLLLPAFIALARIPEKNGLPLGGGSLFALTAVIWALGLVGPVLSLAQERLSLWLFGVRCAVQFGVIAVLAWGFFVARLARPSALAPTAEASLQA